MAKFGQLQGLEAASATLRQGAGQSESELFISGTDLRQPAIDIGSWHSFSCLRPPATRSPPCARPSRPVWRRAAANTLRCLVGCSLGDLSALYLLQTHAAALPVAATVATACAAGIGTSLALETVVLRATEGFAWPLAARTAWNMSLVSMIAMELAENAVEIGLSGGVGCFSLAALPPALLAGFLAPLPYNYYMIRKHGRSCH